MERFHPSMNLSNHATGDVNAIFGGSGGRGNDSILLSVPRTLGISGVSALTTT